MCLYFAYLVIAIIVGGVMTVVFHVLSPGLILLWVTPSLTAAGVTLPVIVPTSQGIHAHRISAVSREKFQSHPALALLEILLILLSNFSPSF